MPPRFAMVTTPSCRRLRGASRGVGRAAWLPALRRRIAAVPLLAPAGPRSSTVASLTLESSCRPVPRFAMAAPALLLEGVDFIAGFGVGFAGLAAAAGASIRSAVVMVASAITDIRSRNPMVRQSGDVRPRDSGGGDDSLLQGGASPRDCGQ